MVSKNLAEALSAINLNEADTREIQSKVTYSELMPFLFGKNLPQLKIEKTYLSELRRESGKYIISYDEYEIKKLIDSGDYIMVKGISASNGLAYGKIAYKHKTIQELRKLEKNVIYLMSFMTPYDIGFLQLSSAVITTEGGATSHAAVTGRKFGIPTITGCSQINCDPDRIMYFIEKHTIKEGDDVLVDATNGTVYFFLGKKPSDDALNMSIVNIQDDDTVEIISKFIYKSIQKHEIFSFGLDLAYVVMILTMREAKSLSKIAELSVDFEYLMTAKQDDVLWKLLLPQLKRLCCDIKDFLDSNLDNQAAVKKELLQTLSRINYMATKSTNNRHQMIFLENTLKKIDNLISAYHFDDHKNSNLNSPKILIVEDEPYLIADTIQRLKNDLNAEVTIITNAQDAIEFIKSATILDLAIVDLMIPDGRDENLNFDPYKGISVSEKLKEIKGESFPIVFLTSVRDTNILEKLLNSTVSRLINKPSLTSSIIETVEDMIRNTNLSDSNLLQSEIQRRKLEIESPDPNMRIRALWALYQYANHDPEIIRQITVMSEKDSNEQVKLVAKRILAQPLMLKDEQFDHNKENKKIEDRSVIIRGNVQNSIIILGDQNSVENN